MSIGLIFWILMLLALVFGLVYGWPRWTPHVFGMSIFVYILLFLIGWSVFGFPIQGR